MNLQNSQYIRVGLFFIFGVVLSWIVYETLNDTASDRVKGYVVQAPFKNLLQLRPCDEVRLAGVKVGVVNSTKLIDNRAVAVLNIYDGILIPVDSVACISSAGLLGNNYVSIEPGISSDSHPPQAMLNARDSSDINTVLSKIGDVVDQFGNFTDKNSPTGSLFSNLNEILSNNKDSLNNLIKNLEEISTKVNSGHGTLGQLVNDGTAYDKILQAATNLASFSTDTQSLVRDVRDGRGMLGALISDPILLADFKATLHNFSDFSHKLNDGESTLGRLISSDDLYQHAESVLNKIDCAANSLSDNGPVSAAGLAAAALF